MKITKPNNMTDYEYSILCSLRKRKEKKAWKIKGQVSLLLGSSCLETGGFRGSRCSVLALGSKPTAAAGVMADLTGLPSGERVRVLGGKNFEKPGPLV